LAYASLSQLARQVGADQLACFARIRSSHSQPTRRCL
jgi:hypothetical protein